MKEIKTLLEVTNLKKYFPIQKGVFRKTVGHVKAVDDVSFALREGETLGLVGESGCGKSTTGRCILRLLEPTSGSVHFHTEAERVEITALKNSAMKKLRKHIQIIFQDPFSSLNPRMTVKNVVAEPLVIQKIGTKKEQAARVSDLLNRVGLDDYHLKRYPHEFSGGQRQRIAIARALSVNPRLVVCDEAVSALDVSIQAQILNLLSKLQKEFNLTYLFIAHDLSVIEHISDRVMVMYLGKIVELASSDDIYKNPKHPYTEALLAAIPIADPRSTKKRLPLEGTVPDPSNTPLGCNFNTRCPYVKAICKQEEPELTELHSGAEHYVACHFAEELSLSGYQDRKSAS